VVVDGWLLISQIGSHSVKKANPCISENSIASDVDQWVEKFVDKSEQQCHKHKLCFHSPVSE